MKLKLNLSLAFVFFILGHGISQQLDHVLGEILVHVNDDIEIKNLENRFQTFNGKDVDFRADKIIAEPMNIWKISFDNNVIDENKFLYAIKSKSLNAQFNHLISYRAIPNDPQFDQQWQYINTGMPAGTVDADLDIDSAWDVTTGGLTSDGDTIVVCIVDDGLDPSHDDFGSNIWINHAEIPNNGIDDDGNGYVDDYQGWDAYNDDDNIYAGGGHGTPVAGIVGAKGNNGIGVAGVNWDVKLMIVRGGGNEAQALAAYAYPYAFRKLYNETNGSQGAFVVATNSSWGIDFGQPDDAPLWCQFYDSLGVQGIISCGATINNDVDVDVNGDLPTGCSSDYLITVTNMNFDDEKVTFAGYGTTTIDLGAFGAETWTTAFGNSYAGFGGTSGATPHVTGTVGLLHSLPCPQLIGLIKANPAAGALLVKDYILNGVDPNESLEGITVTGGRLNVNNSINLALQNCGPCPPGFVTGVEVTDINAIVSWETPADAISVNLQYQPLGSNSWNILNDVTSPLTLNDLDPCTEYQIQLQSICMDTLSDFAGSFTFITEGCCEAPALPVVSYSDQGVPTLIWNNIFGAIEYQIEYRLVGSTNWISVTSETNSFEVNDLMECSQYEARITANCGNLISEPTEIVLFVSNCGACSTLAYCEWPEINNDFEWMESIDINGVNNVSGMDENSNANYVGAFSFDLTEGESYTVTLTPGFSTIEYDEWWKVWVDWNQNGDFEDEELMINSMEAIATVYTEDFVVPNDVLDGYTRMRVIMAFAGEPDNCGQNGNISFGEVEDYCVFVTSLPDCDFLPEPVPSSNVFIDTIMWNGSEDAIAYNCRYKAENDNEWIYLSTIDSFVVFEQLEECARYEIQVRGVCAFDTTTYSPSAFFRFNCSTSTNETALGIESISIAPNPFMHNADVLFELSDTRNLNIQVFDIQGKLIRRIENRNYFDGTNRVNLNMRDESSGIYFVRLTDGRNAVSKKLIKIR